MFLLEEKAVFEASESIYESTVLEFFGVDGFDVYNTSIPFSYGGKNYIFGRVERRSEWARSWVRLFEGCGEDKWKLVEDSMIYQLEDPYISFIGENIVMGGTHVLLRQSKIGTYYGYFYKGDDLSDLHYFTTGPDHMKDIRLVELSDGKIGVFSRPRNEEIKKKFNCDSMIGFAIIDSLDDLNDKVVEEAPYIEGFFKEGEWGGCNQAYLLESGKIGVIGHKCYNDKEKVQLVYLNIAFVFDPKNRRASDVKIIGTRSSYPKGESKKPNLKDCAFTSGIVMREDGKADLYSGIGDCAEGRAVIDYPFEGHGKIVSKQGRYL